MSASGGRLGLLAGAALLGALTVGAVGVWALSKAAAPSSARSATPGPLDPDPGLEGLRIPDFQLVDQQGRKVDAAALLDGKVTIVDFIFTNCPFICPPMTRNMAQLQRSLADSGVRFASISVDPEHDTPEALRAFAAAHGADLRTWTFLTGDGGQVERILTEGLKLDAPAPLPQTPIELKDGSTMANIRHPSHFVLVGPDRRVLALTIGTQASLHEAFAQRARAAAEALAVRSAQRPSGG